MKKHLQKAMIYLFVFATVLTGTFAETDSQSLAASFKQYTDSEVYESGIAAEQQKYYSISNAYIASYTSAAITFSWYSAGNNDGFYIYRKCKYDTAYQKIGTVENIQNSSHTFKDTSFKRGIRFSYRIIAYMTDSEGNVTELGGVATTFKAALGKAALSDVKRKASKVVIKWKKVSGADGYEIYRKAGNGSYKKVKTVKSGTTLKYTTKKLAKNKTYKFKVRAYVKYGSNHSYGSFSKVKTVYTISVQKVANKIKKLQKKFPAGKYWNHVGKSKYNSSTITNKPCDHSKGNGLSTCNHYNCPNGVLGYQCYGFAWKMSDLIYGKNAKIKNFHSFSKCRMGDVIRYQGHSVIVIEKHRNYILVGECNAGNTCIISWGRKVYRSELKNATYSRRY